LEEIICNDQSLRVLHCSYLISIGILLIHGNSVYFPGVKRPRHIIKQPLPFNVEVKERVELYLYSPSGISWRVLEQHFIYLFIFLFIYVFICGIFDEATINSVHKASNEKFVEEKGCGLTRYFPGIFREKLRKPKR
jgi:hypothetical protein